MSKVNKNNTDNLSLYTIEDITTPVKLDRPTQANASNNKQKIIVHQYSIKRSINRKEKRRQHNKADFTKQVRTKQAMKDYWYDYNDGNLDEPVQE